MTKHLEILKFIHGIIAFRVSISSQPSTTIRHFYPCVPIISSQENKLFFRVIGASRKVKRNREANSCFRSRSRHVDYVMNHTNYTLSVLLLHPSLPTLGTVLGFIADICPRQPTVTPSSSSASSLFLFLFSLLRLILPPCLDSQEVHRRYESIDPSFSSSNLFLF